MKRIFFLLNFILGTSYYVFAQKTVLINDSNKRVPAGMAWEIKVNDTLVIVPNDSMMQSDSKCKTDFFSEPGFIKNISFIIQDYKRTDYGLVFKIIKQMDSPSKNSYEVILLAIVPYDFILRPGDIAYKNSGVKQIYADQWQFIMPGNCLKMITAKEYVAHPEVLKMMKKDGDSGNPTGRASGYEGSGQGNGTGEGTGMSSGSRFSQKYTLEGRQLLNKPFTDSIANAKGRVIIDITVNAKGKVVEAKGPARGSTTMSAELVKSAKEQALKARFNKVKDKEDQKGTMMFMFYVK